MPRSKDLLEVLSTARTIRRFTDEPVDDAALAPCPEAASSSASEASSRTDPGIHQAVMGLADRPLPPTCALSLRAPLRGSRQRASPVSQW